MKKIIILIFILFAFTGTAFAANTGGSSTASAVNRPIGQIENLKERLATKVAELQQVQRKAIVGVVKAVSISTITVETKSSDVKIELTDNIKVFQTIKGKRTELSTDDISKDDMVVVFGDYDATLDLLKAKVIIIQDPLPIRVTGIISAIDRKNYTATIQSFGGSPYVIDIWNTTAITSLDSSNQIVKSGFSKISVGEYTQIVGTAEPKKDNYISAIRFLDLGFINGTPTPTPTSGTDESTKSGQTRTPKPTTKASPTP